MEHCSSLLALGNWSRPRLAEQTEGSPAHPTASHTAAGNKTRPMWELSLNPCHPNLSTKTQKNLRSILNQFPMTCWSTRSSLTEPQRGCPALGASTRSQTRRSGDLIATGQDHWVAAGTAGTGSEVLLAFAAAGFAEPGWEELVPPRCRWQCPGFAEQDTCSHFQQDTLTPLPSWWLQEGGQVGSRSCLHGAAGAQEVL